jgi:hypothetical protein
MPVYIDVHEHLAEEVTPQTVADAHARDIEVQQKHGVRFLQYWFNEEARRLYCLVEAPSKEAAEAVHREAHGLVADEILEVRQGPEPTCSLRLPTAYSQTIAAT